MGNFRHFQWLEMGFIIYIENVQKRVKEGFVVFYRENS